MQWSDCISIRPEVEARERSRDERKDRAGEQVYQSRAREEGVSPGRGDFRSQKGERNVKCKAGRRTKGAAHVMERLLLEPGRFTEPAREFATNFRSC